MNSDDELAKLRSERDLAFETTRSIERDLGDKAYLPRLIEQLGKAAALAHYDEWRAHAKTKLLHTQTRYRTLREEIQQIEEAQARALPTVQLLEEVWVNLKRYPEMQELCERLRLFVRDSYHVYLKDRKSTESDDSKP
jgi:hypothetical protein